jgi:hypothetical protein
VVPHRVTVTTICDNDDKEVDGSYEEYVMVAECDFERQARQSSKHFEKFLEAACSNQAYLVKHKLKEYTMIKNLMTSKALQGKEG